MHGEIRVALAIPLLGIGESRVAYRHALDDFFLSERQRTERLCEQLHLDDTHGHLARARAKQRARHADHVADIEEAEDVVRRVTQHVLLEVQLYASTVVRGVRERGLAVRAPRHDAPRDAYRLPFFLRPLRMKGQRIGRAMRTLE